MSNVEEKQEKALSVFRQPPLRYNCAQAVLYAFKDDVDSGKLKTDGTFDELVEKTMRYGGGNGPKGYCGSLLSAIMLKPDMEDAFIAEFDKEATSHFCREIKAAAKYKCEDCVKLGAKLVAESMQ